VHHVAGAQCPYRYVLLRVLSLRVSYLESNIGYPETGVVGVFEIDKLRILCQTPLMR
jgi:hypothetical protein